MKRNRALRRNAFFWFLVAVVGLEIGAFAVSPYRDHPAAAEVNRNPTPLRGWPEYVSGDAVDHRELVVMIGTSQGLGLEFSDDRGLFFSRMRRELAVDHPDILLENWSVAGLTTDQLELLGLQAVKRQASLVVFLVSLGNMDETHRFRLDTDAADVDLLAGDLAVWPDLYGTALFERSAYHDFLLRGLLLNTHLGRSRIAALDVAAEYLPVEKHGVVFGARRSSDARQTIVERLDAPRRGMQFSSLFSDALKLDATYYERQYRKRRLPVFNAVYADLRERFKAAGVDMLWVWTPLAAKGMDKLLEGAAPIQAEICRRIEAEGWDCVDETRSLPLDHFLVGDLASHLNQKGHAELARILTPVVRDAVH